MRFAQTQVWPALRYLEAMEPSTAASRSASSKTMNGALPPSSSESFLIVSAHCFMSVSPVSVEPVKESLRTAGLAHSSPPMAREFPVMTLNTPFGMPARSRSEEHTSELQSQSNLVCRLLLEKKKENRRHERREKQMRD